MKWAPLSGKVNLMLSSEIRCTTWTESRSVWAVVLLSILQLVLTTLCKAEVCFLHGRLCSIIRALMGYCLSYFDRTDWNQERLDHLLQQLQIQVTWLRCSVLPKTCTCLQKVLFLFHYFCDRSSWLLVRFWVYAWVSYCVTYIGLLFLKVFKKISKNHISLSHFSALFKMQLYGVIFGTHDNEWCK